MLYLTEDEITSYWKNKKDSNMCKNMIEWLRSHAADPQYHEPETKNDIELMRESTFQNIRAQPRPGVSKTCFARHSNI